MSEAGGASFPAVARLYLGNVLYALEVTALGLQQDGKLEDAAFYRGIARELTDAYRREQTDGAPTTGA